MIHLLSAFSFLAVVIASALMIAYGQLLFEKGRIVGGVGMYLAAVATWLLHALIPWPRPPEFQPWPEQRPRRRKHNDPNKGKGV